MWEKYDDISSHHVAAYDWIQFIVKPQAWVLFHKFCVRPVTLTQFEQPAFSIRVEESMSQVIAIIFRDFKGLVLDALIEVLHEL